jgi:hypothetical protein
MVCSLEIRKEGRAAYSSPNSSRIARQWENIASIESLSLGRINVDADKKR